MYYEFEQIDKCAEVVRSRILTVKEGGIKIQNGEGKKYLYVDGLNLKVSTLVYHF